MLLHRVEYINFTAYGIVCKCAQPTQIYGVVICKLQIKLVDWMMIPTTEPTYSMLAYIKSLKESSGESVSFSLTLFFFRLSQKHNIT